LNPKYNPNIVKANSYRLVKNSNLLNANEPAQNGVSKETWANINLETQPAGALLALLTQYQNNAKALESDVVDQLYQKVNEDGIIFNEFSAQILAKSNYVMEGENFEADVLLVASNSTTDPIIKLNGSDLSTVERGVGKVSIPARGVGLKTVNGEIILEDPLTGKPTSYAFKKEYQVFKPVATISADKLNLLYVGIDNPLSISVPGFSAADISVSASSGGSVTGGNGKYNIKVSSGSKTVDISVRAKGRLMGTSSYRVRNVPAPRGQMGGLTKTNVAYPASAVCAQNRVLASLGMDFAYDMNFVVNKYTITLVFNNKPAVRRTVNGNAIPSDIRSQICNMRRGEKVLIEGIKAKDSRYGIVKTNIDNVIITIR
jgi:gliding motility-associated protein GldM